MKQNSFLIEADELLAKMGDENVRIYDATIMFYVELSREEADKMPTAYEKYLEGHIPGSAYFDHKAFSDSTSPYMYMMLSDTELGKQIGNIGIAENSEVIFYANGLLPCATRAWWILHYAGHNNVKVLNGGLTAWKKAGGKIELSENKYTPMKFECQPNTKLFASKEDILAVMEDEMVRTVNTLDINSYNQAHIKGSVCLPCMDLMEGWDYFLPEEEISSRLKVEAQQDRIIAYCGGGIAATVNAMAHLMVGNKNVAVYDGSMDEWSGEGLPITKGVES